MDLKKFIKLQNFIRDVEDFPIDGVVFKDITPLLSSPIAFKFAIDELAKNIGNPDHIVGLDARGFIFGGALAYKLGIPFIPIRKKGKLPYKTIDINYDLEYGSNSLEMHIDGMKKGDKIAIVDDLLATGGTMEASLNLIEQLGGKIESINFVINLKFLNGEEKLKGYKINSLLEY